MGGGGGAERGHRVPFVSLQSRTPVGSCTLCVKKGRTGALHLFSDWDDTRTHTQKHGVALSQLDRLFYGDPFVLFCFVFLLLFPCVSLSLFDYHICYNCTSTYTVCLLITTHHCFCLLLLLIHYVFQCHLLKTVWYPHEY